MPTSSQQHWNSIFSTKADPQLGWYEKDTSQTLKFLNLIPAMASATIFMPGAGTSVLVDELLPKCAHLILNDISDEALRKLKSRIGKQEGKVSWLHHDISSPLPDGIPASDLWIDRAVLHFLLDEAKIDAYFKNLRATLREQGHVLLAEFSTHGASKCAGLDLHRYSVEEMSERLGSEFTILKEEKYNFMNPFGHSRPYVYALYKKSRD